MDYKEKYEKAYKLLKQMHDGGIVSKIDIENTFHEFKKKSVIDMLKIAIANTAWLDCDKNKCLSWLEEQGNTNETINRDKFAQDVLRGAAINLIVWIDYNAAEGNMCLSNMECKDIEDALVSGNWDKIYAYIKKKLEKQGEQKSVEENKGNIVKISSVWSKEDEDAIGMAIEALEDLYDEDDPSVSFIDHYLSFDEAAKRLKALKPQPHWKPTKEQIYALSMAYKDSLAGGENLPTQTETLKSLYNDLKKL